MRRDRTAQQALAGATGLRRQSAESEHFLAEDAKLPWRTDGDADARLEIRLHAARRADRRASVQLATQAAEKATMGAVDHDVRSTITPPSDGDEHAVTEPAVLNTRAKARTATTIPRSPLRDPRLHASVQVTGTDDGKLDVEVGEHWRSRPELRRVPGAGHSPSVPSPLQQRMAQQVTARGQDSNGDGGSGSEPPKLAKSVSTAAAEYMKAVAEFRQAAASKTTADNAPELQTSEQSGPVNASQRAQRLAGKFGMHVPGWGDGSPWRGEKCVAAQPGPPPRSTWQLRDTENPPHESGSFFTPQGKAPLAVGQPLPASLIPARYHKVCTCAALVHASLSSHMRAVCCRPSGFPPSHPGQCQKMDWSLIGTLTAGSASRFRLPSLAIAKRRCAFRIRHRRVDHVTTLTSAHLLPLCYSLLAQTTDLMLAEVYAASLNNADASKVLASTLQQVLQDGSTALQHAKKRAKRRSVEGKPRTAGAAVTGLAEAEASGAAEQRLAALLKSRAVDFTQQVNFAEYPVSNPWPAKFREELAVWEAVLVELVRQIATGCEERGVLLDKARQRLFHALAWADRSLGWMMNVRAMQQVRVCVFVCVCVCVQAPDTVKHWSRYLSLSDSSPWRMTWQHLRGQWAKHWKLRKRRSKSFGHSSLIASGIWK